MTTVSPVAAPTQTGGRSIRLSRLSDELLARHAARGSQRAFTALYERYHQPLYRYCRSILRHDADAQDALQSTFTGALAALQRDARTAPLRPWLYRIAHNESVSLLRRRKRDSHYEVVTEFSAIGSSAEEEAAGRARWRRLVDDLAELPERQRGALLLRELAGLSHEEIALTLGLSVGTAKQAIFEAREGLAELEEGRAMSCEEVRQRISEGDRRVLRGRRVRSHLRACVGCEAFALAIPARKAQLRALTPVLPPAAAAALLGRTLHAASAHGAAAAGSGASAGSAATAGAVGKAASTVVIWKAAAGVAVLATAAAGVTGLTHVLQHGHLAAHRVMPTQGHAAPAAGDHAGAASAASAHPGSASRSAARHATTRQTSQRHGASGASRATGHAKHHSHGATGAGASVAPPSASSTTSTSPSTRGASHTHAATKTSTHAGSRSTSHRHLIRSSPHVHGHPRVALHTQVHTPAASLSTPTDGTTGSATKHAQKTASAVTGG